MSHILILNATLGGTQGNTYPLLNRAKQYLEKTNTVTEVILEDKLDFTVLEPLLAQADAFLIGTGTHWDSWSSRLQQFLELATPTEGSNLWLGKPAGVIVTMHSVGGKGVLSRLQGVLNTYGCLIPPMSGMVYSWANQVTLASTENQVVDVWCPADVDIICFNLETALGKHKTYKAWDMDHTHFNDKWIKN